MRAGDKLKVFEAGHPERMVGATVIIASDNLNSLALALGEGVVYANEPTMAVHPDYGRMLVLLRDEDTRPFWEDILTRRKVALVV